MVAEPGHQITGAHDAIDDISRQLHRRIGNRRRSPGRVVVHTEPHREHGENSIVACGLLAL